MIYAGGTIERMNHVCQERGVEGEIRMRTFVVIVFALIGGLFIGYLLLELVGTLLFAGVSVLGTDQILWRVALVCAAIALIVGVLIRSRSR